MAAIVVGCSVNKLYDSLLLDQLGRDLLWDSVQHTETPAHTTFCPYFCAIPRLLKCLKTNQKVKHWLHIFHWSQSCSNWPKQTASNKMSYFGLTFDTPQIPRYSIPAHRRRLWRFLRRPEDMDHDVASSTASKEFHVPKDQHIQNLLLIHWSNSWGWCFDSCHTYCHLKDMAAWKFLVYNLTWSWLLAAIVCWSETKAGIDSFEMIFWNRTDHSTQNTDHLHHTQLFDTESCLNGMVSCIAEISLGVLDNMLVWVVTLLKYQ